MTTKRLRLYAFPDAVMASGASAAVGVSGILGVAALSTGDARIAVLAVAMGVLGMGLLFVAGWIEPLGLVAIASPLPALFSSESLRVPPVLLVTALVVGAWVLRRGLVRRPLAVHRASLLPPLALAVGVLLAAPFADVRSSAARESVSFLLLAGLAVVTLDLVGARRERAVALMRWIAVAAAAAGLAGGLEAVGLVPGRFPLAGTGFYRSAGGFGWPNELGMFLAISLPIVIYQVRAATTPVTRTGWLLLTMMVALGLVSTFSRGSWIAVAVAPVVLLFVGEARFAFRFWIVGLAGVVAADVLTVGAISTRIIATAGDPLVGQRLLLSAAGLLMFQSSPIVGVGPGGFPSALDDFGPQISGLFDFVGSAHNGYVHVAAEAGLVGLAGLLYFFGSALRSHGRGARAASLHASTALERSLAPPLLWSLTTACVVTLIEWPFAQGIGQLIVVVAALGMAESQRQLGGS